jgi:hypothetical protein
VGPQISIIVKVIIDDDDDSDRDYDMMNQGLTFSDLLTTEWAAKHSSYANTYH